jgi:phage/plasmid-like protein (TIGR03299 family)
MPHDLATTNGQPSMAFYGPSPWHGLGKRLAAPATAKEAIVASGLDFTVDLRPLMTEDGLPVAKRRAVVRRDTDVVLGTVGSGYTPIQNVDAFQFLDEVAGEGHVRFHTAGGLGRGERIWMLAKLPGNLRVSGTDDISKKFLLLSNSHDGSSSLRVFYTPIRVVCSNTLVFAHRQGRGQGISIVHRGDVRSRVDEARRLLGLADRMFDRYGEQINVLAKRQLTAVEVEEFFWGLYPDGPDEKRGRSRAIRERLEDLFENGLGQDLPGIRHTAWAAVNAVSEFTDHYRTTRGRDARTRVDRRLASAWFGSGAQVKLRAWEQALALAT